MCYSNTSQFINRILRDNINCNSSNVWGNNCGCGCGCNNNCGGSSNGCNSCGCECVGGTSSNGCSCGCDNDDSDSCDCAQAITNRLLYEILNELRAVREFLCGCNG